MREYTNGEVTVLWDMKKCIHSANCIRNLPSVFDVKASPWIDMKGASSQEITTAVHKCPSGALSMKGEAATVGEPSTTISVTAHGPYLVEGECIVEHADGSKETKKGIFALCRCGSSGNKPFCDGSHKKVGF